MVQTIKSVLYFDFDSIYRSLNRQRPGSGEQLGARAGAWLEAMETGELIVPRSEETRRRLIAKRCYADPKVLGKNRGWLAANGVQIIDCPQLTGLSRTPADIHMVLDAGDALERAADVEEFILLSAEADLTPLTFRLRAHNKRVIVYAAEGIASSYKTLADATLPESMLLGVLGRSASEPGTTRVDPTIPRPPVIQAPRAAQPPPPPPVQPAAQPQPAAPRASGSARVPARTQAAIDREALASLVRRIHQATNVPLFSPKAFAELFQVLAREVAENGYRFQSTAENVAERMVALGRNVTKRQVGFVVKGLALRGHVFNADDHPEDLARTFYDQVLYLADSSNMALTEAERGMVLAWVAGLQSRPIDEPLPVEPEVEPATAATRRVAEREVPQPRPVLRDEPVKPPLRRPSAERVIVPPPPKMPGPPPDVDTERAPRPASRPAAAAKPNPLRAAARPLRPLAEGEAARTPLASVRSAAAERARSGAAAKPPVKKAEEAPKSEMEDTILAAIAEAVDVLVEDRATDKPRVEARSEPRAEARAEPRPEPRVEARPEPRAEPRHEARAEPRPERSPPRQAERAPPRAAEPPPPPPKPEPATMDSDDIGDEIQRILASYSKNR